VTPTCSEGKCAIIFDGQCEKVDAGPGDCETLRATYLNALAAAQQCYAPQNPTECWAHSPDACGCDVPYDGAGPCATVVASAFEDLQNAQCSFLACAKPCVASTAAGAVCVPNTSGTMGTCAWK